jgi:hypothetical protein
VRLVAGQQALQHVAARGGTLYLWPRGIRCCAGRSYVLEASTAAPDRHFLRLHEEHGISVWAPPGLAEPDEVHVELDRRGNVRAFWNGQAWIG